MRWWLRGAAAWRRWRRWALSTGRRCRRCRRRPRRWSGSWRRRCDRLGAPHFPEKTKLGLCVDPDYHILGALDGALAFLEGDRFGAKQGAANGDGPAAKRAKTSA